MNKDIYLLQGITLTTLRDWLNENKRKDNGNAFTINDAKAYCCRGKLPVYLGGNRILRAQSSDERVKLYNVLK